MLLHVGTNTLVSLQRSAHYILSPTTQPFTLSVATPAYATSTRHAGVGHRQRVSSARMRREDYRIARCVQGSCGLQTQLKFNHLLCEQIISSFGKRQALTPSSANVSQAPSQFYLSLFSFHFLCICQCPMGRAHNNFELCISSVLLTVISCLQTQSTRAFVRLLGFRFQK